MQDGPIYDRYRVVYSDWSPVDPRERFFVLSMDTDRYARWALAAYIKACRNEYQNYANQLNSEYHLQLTMPHYPDKVDGPPLPQYKVTHKDGHPVHPALRFFVLAVDTDEYAREALCSYAQDCRETHPQLSEDMIREYSLELRP